MIMRQSLSKLVYEDIGFEDLTTRALIPPGLAVDGRIIAKEEGILAGIELADDIFHEFSVETSILRYNGQNLGAGQVIMEVSGDPRNILSVERTVLNLLMRMSGIATITKKMHDKAKSANSEIILAGTRKTTPGLQFFEKDAIRSGGGDTHRYRLDDCVLIKDNHLALVGDVAEVVKRAKKYVSFTKKIEIEVETMDGALEAARSGVDIIMLDNMPIKDILKVLSALNEQRLRDKVIVEVSGGVNLDNIEDYAKTGVDVISTGYLTHSAKSLDMSLEIQN
jgi:nicotinate-nucleotide pyrophosphorylase (carboxylating)